jgi:transcriptional regulator with XRE-family HTH domain
LSQKALGDRLGLKEQQIQRYEAERYASASYSRVQAIAKAIGVEVRKEILLPSSATNLPGVLHKLRQVGISQDFVFGHLLSSRDIAASNLDEYEPDDSLLMAKLADTVSRVYGWTNAELFAPQPLSAPKFAGASARFKMPARRAQGTVSAYTTYAHYLASVCLLATADLPCRPIPTDPNEMRDSIVSTYGTCDLRSALRFLWDHGVPVLPLRGSGAFHGATWRHDGRNVIVLKQRSPHEQRWLYDILHEAFHAGSEPERLTHET